MRRVERFIVRGRGEEQGTREDRRKEKDETVKEHSGTEDGEEEEEEEQQEEEGAFFAPSHCFPVYSSLQVLTFLSHVLNGNGRQN